MSRPSFTARVTALFSPACSHREGREAGSPGERLGRFQADWIGGPGCPAVPLACGQPALIRVAVALVNLALGCGSRAAGATRGGVIASWAAAAFYSGMAATLQLCATQWDARAILT